MILLISQSPTPYTHNLLLIFFIDADYNINISIETVMFIAVISIEMVVKNMVDLGLQMDNIQKVKKEVVILIREKMQDDIDKVILYGSCARGDYTEDSDIDIALLTSCNRNDAKKYSKILAEIATKLAMEYYVVINFVCIPCIEFIQKKTWYPYFKSIERDGEVLYG
ncbi:nucleotidyltransferase domain-containing protein [Schaedlerella sp.]|uniref:nucleotidyltransferase domain-containing protein n=1 Tax=Schaedlerella sp. TaxID=2676057 RepID=UPI00265FFFFE|nr:nucleotidyltransferase domain-containing protein [uncultured Schaedlerella sp.]